MEKVKLDNLVVLMGHKQGKYPSANAVLVDDDVRLLVDPSVDLDRVGRGAVSGGVDMIINSHAHEDHFAGNHLFPEAELVVHEKEVPAMSSLQGLMDNYGMASEMAVGGEHDWARVVVEVFHFTPRDEMKAVSDGDVIDLGRTRVHCIHTPGHTGGHMALLFEPNDVLFLADLDLTAFGPYYGDACSSLAETISSIKKVMEMADGLRACISSHQAGIVREKIRTRMESFLNVLWERDEILLAFLKEPRTLEEIGERCIVYGKRYPDIPWQLQAERIMMKMHAQRLQEQGRVTVEPDGRFRAA